MNGPGPVQASLCDSEEIPIRIAEEENLGLESDSSAVGALLESLFDDAGGIGEG